MPALLPEPMGQSSKPPSPSLRHAAGGAGTHFPRLFLTLPASKPSTQMLVLPWKHAQNLVSSWRLPCCPLALGAEAEAGVGTCAPCLSAQRAAASLARAPPPRPLHPDGPARSGQGVLTPGLADEPLPIQWWRRPGEAWTGDPSNVGPAWLCGPAAILPSVLAWQLELREWHACGGRVGPLPSPPRPAIGITFLTQTLAVHEILTLGPPPGAPCSPLWLQGRMGSLLPLPQSLRPLIHPDAILLLRLLHHCGHLCGALSSDRLSPVSRAGSLRLSLLEGRTQPPHRPPPAQARLLKERVTG